MPYRGDSYDFERNNNSLENGLDHLYTNLNAQEQEQHEQAGNEPSNNTNNNNDININVNNIKNGKPPEHSEHYTPADKYKLYTIYGNDIDNDKLSGIPHSTTGSLSSIITTSIASSEPDPGSEKVGCDVHGYDEKAALNRPGLRHEPWWHILLQVSIPFFIAGVGTIGAGIVLGRVEKWTVFQSVSELFILVPALLGLKGNLDMCLASRLSTQANLGNMTSPREIIKMIVGNISLVQVQAIVASFIVANFAIVVGGLMNGEFKLETIMLLISSSMFTATSSCFVLDFVLVAVILISRKFKMNPDNLATPFAASIGDIVSLSVLSFIASILYEQLEKQMWITYIVMGIYVCLLPMWVTIVYRNKYTKKVLTSGWVPVLSALFISGLGGLVLDKAVDVFNGFVVFQPIVNGIGGNLVSVQASKISTMLHQSSIIGIIPPHTRIFELPWRALFKGVPYARTARILLALSIAGQLVFVYAADFIHWSETTIEYPFLLSYLFVSFIQVMLLLYVAHIIIHVMWKWKIDPDNSAIPYLTALGDLLGSCLLALAFLFLKSIGREYASDRSELTDDTQTVVDPANLVGLY